MDLGTEISRFFSRIEGDSRICPVHISLFLAIVCIWQESNFQSPVCLVSKELMRLAKISGSATYYRCIRDLDQFGYISYKPSHNCFKGSKVYMVTESEIKS